MFDQSESSLFLAINELSGHVRVIDQVMVALSHSYTWFICAAIVAVVSARTRDSKLLSALICSVLALGVSDLISFEIIKPLIGRERPCWVLPEARTILGRCGGSYGFTSNHAANAFAVWTVVATFYGARSKASILTLWLATSVSISRVYLGVHYVGDVAGGALLGASVAASMNALGLRRVGDFLAAKIIARAM